jgi:hypothetical protein
LKADTQRPREADKAAKGPKPAKQLQLL